MVMPNWYWEKGLHDAKIISCQIENFNYDYSKPNPVRNCITIELDSGMAMFDTTLKAIKFFNAKFIQGDIQGENWFWNYDIIKENSKGYELEINLVSYPKRKKCKIVFENVIIER